MPMQQPSFTPYLMHNLINQGNGAYMQDSSRIAFLQDHCNMLERHLVKVMTERDTIKNLFDQLANTMKLPTCDPNLLLSGNLPVPTLSSVDEKRPTHETHPNVRFWTKTDYNNWLDSPEAAGSNRGLYAYLEDENGDVPKSETLGKIRKALQAGCTSALQFIRLQTEKEFPLFKLADNGWKLEYICTKTYSAWRKHHLDDNGNLKRTTHDVIKEEGLNDNNDLEDCKPCRKKQKGPPDTTRPSIKKQKVDNVTLAPQLKATTPIHEHSPTSSSSSSSVPPPTSLDAVPNVEPMMPEFPAEAEGTNGGATEQLPDSEDYGEYSDASTAYGAQSPDRLIETATLTTPPAETTAAQYKSQEVGPALAEKSNTCVANSTDISGTAASIPYNPMSLLALAAAKVEMTPLPPVLAPSTKSPSTLNSINVVLPVHPACDATGVVESKENNQVTKGKAKLRPSGMKNGQNLCMLRWLKQVDGNGQRDDFREYYDKMLMQAQCEAYDKEAKQLVETNSWTKAIIKRGTLH
ncbi:hypothetical protein PISMIDRAFT_15388 [Pisolithus microcarpus 441]|uniref:Uncharacterized protein n=1 Tax=Pisolithus microcarpus 441 TaxID=765257 RepID=A0A0C9YST8_9AGAM|nr:hypothetical protein PISMIDRAFT_15388 [Pisolithus microcarpus 441]